MTRKDYIELARAFARAKADRWEYPEEGAGIYAAQRAVMEALRADNPRFDRDRFTAEVDRQLRVFLRRYLCAECDTLRDAAGTCECVAMSVD